MIPIALADVCRATQGRLADGAAPSTMVTGPVVIDSRRAAPGALFVCLRGERVDGHDYAADAVAAGAVAVLAGREVGVPAVVVDDPQAALGQVASAVLALARGCRVVGVTGSSGKTSTKDLLWQVYERDGQTVAPEASFNNELGMPLTVLRIEPTTRTLVCEYSARGRGHIRYLCGIARPTTGIVLNVGAAHLGEFGSREAIAEAKGELVEALPDDGVAVLNADDALVAAMRRRTRARVLTFGSSADADVQVADLELDDLARPRFTLRAGGRSATLALQLHGAHHAMNATAAAAAALGDGLAFDDVVDALSLATSRSARRMAVHTRADGLLVVDDSYNANPESTRAAIDALMELARPGSRRTWAVLGEMRELGDAAPGLHEEVGVHAARSGVDELVAIGAAAPVAAGAGSVGGWSGRARVLDDVAAAVDLVLREVRSGDVVLVKASNGVAAWQVADALLAAGDVGATA